ncbi:MAG: undecaprenyl/decaprenyl-phosphate alpha-N-acetylglucosaminyl 1-phosphate transferase, partial [Deferribacteres bacterium]|nr:undecaprenyl/decaprenyl-phosphate alpha-N-acetylglucosaminyl 1-phosphate transferase [Deferribacteres bacterium]
MDPVIPFLLSLPAAYLSTFLFKRLALLCGIMDVPDHRKIHRAPMPLLGGLAVYLAVILGVSFDPAVLRHISGILAGATVILIIGLVDDARGLSAPVKLSGQLIAAAIMIYSGVRISFFPDTWAGYAGEVLLTLVWVAGITNAVNYLDGIDGLAAGSTAISAVFFVIVSYITDQPLTGMAALILFAGCMGFLPHNFKRAGIFLGDAGSTFLGFMLAGIAIAGNWAEDNMLRLSIPVLILGVPIFDMTFTTVMRIREKKVGT